MSAEPPVVGRTLAGVVVDFDAARGVGTVVDDAGREYRFHSTRIADGTRFVEVGSPVVFVVGAGLMGRWEAVEVRPQPRSS